MFYEYKQVKFRELNSIWMKTNIVKSFQGPPVMCLSKLMYDFQETPWQVILLICHCFPDEFFIRECNRNLRTHTSEKHINIYLKHNIETNFTCSWGFVISLAQLCGFQKHASRKETFLFLRVTVGKRFGFQGYTVFLINMYNFQDLKNPSLN